MRRVLFVDDEPQVLAGLKRVLDPLRNEWQMAFVDSGPQALTALAQSKYDVLVTDIRMTGMSGLELLAETGKRHPDVLRIVLSGTADWDITIKSTHVAHQYLVKPCNPKTLRTTIERAMSLRLVLDDATLRQTVSSLQSLPSMPGTYMRLMNAVKSPDASTMQVGEIVARDVGMSSKVLQLVNSAFFGAGQPIVDPVAAVVYLGLETISALALQVAVFSQFDARLSREFSFDSMQRHSQRVAVAAKQIALNLGMTRVQANDCMAAGLLHDIGKLVLASNFPERYRLVGARMSEADLSSAQAEQEIFGSSHAEVGAYLLWLWGLPDALTEAVAFHHRPPVCSNAPVTTAAAVYAANFFEHSRAADSDDPHILALASALKRDWPDITDGLHFDFPK